MAKYKLSYFNLRVQAEPIRYMFELAGVHYIDNRVSEEEWMEQKTKPGIGQLPVLEVDGREIPQSRAIYRFVAREHGFYPTNNWESALVEVVLETVRDFDPEMNKFFSQGDSAKRDEIRRDFMEKGVEKYLRNIENLLRDNNNGAEWFVGKQISLADTLVFYLIYDVIPSLIGKDPGTFELGNHGLLKSFMSRFQAQPKLSAWLSKRPSTPF